MCSDLTRVTVEVLQNTNRNIVLSGQGVALMAGLEGSLEMTSFVRSFV